MARAHAEVQERTTGSHQDIEDAGIDDVLSILFPERANLYTGDNAFTVADMEAPGMTRDAIVRRGAQAVERGELVEVIVERLDKSNRTKWLKAWVKADLYAEWTANNDDSTTKE